MKVIKRKKKSGYKILVNKQEAISLACLLNTSCVQSAITKVFPRGKLPFDAFNKIEELKHDNRTCNRHYTTGGYKWKMDISPSCAISGEIQTHFGNKPDYPFRDGEHKK